MFGTHSNATGPTKLLGYRASTSIYGKGIPILVGGTNRISGNTIWIGDWDAKPASSGGKGGSKGSAKGGGQQYNYTASYIQAICRGPVSLISVWQDRSQVLNGSQYPVFIAGNVGQGVWGFLSSNHAGEDLGYSGIALGCYQKLNLGTGGTISNYSYEVQKSDGLFSGQNDALVSYCINFLLTDLSMAGFPSSALGSLTEVATYCQANGLWISPVVDQQQQLSSYLQEFLQIANSEAFSSEGVIKFRTYGDKAVTGNGITFTPSLSPLFALNNDEFICSPGQPPVTFTVDAIQDRDNAIPVEWTNRGNQYNLETLTPEEDVWAIQQYGRNLATPLSLHSVCNASVAQSVAQTRLRRSIYMLRKCSFTLGWAYSDLEPMDIVSIPEQYPSTSMISVRILSIDENENGDLACTAEVLPFPILGPVIHPKQSTGGGYSPGYSAAPGDALAPIFFEEPYEMTQGIGFALLVALAGGPNWGGASVWVSEDGTDYTYQGRLETASNRGILSAAFASHADPDTTDTLSVDLRTSRGSLSAYTQAQADQYASLALIDGQELIAYTTATLTGSNQYNLTSYIRRGVFGTLISPHASGVSFVALDGSEFEFPYQVSDIGKTKYFKFTSFNLAGQNEQDISTVTAYPYRFTGAFQRAPYTLKPSYLALQPPSDDSLSTASTFGLQPTYTLDKAGNPIVSVNLFGFLPPNQLSRTIKQPILSGYSVATTGGNVPGGITFLVAIAGADASTSPRSLSQISNVLAVTTPVGTNTNKITVNASFDSATAGFLTYAGATEDLLEVNQDFQTASSSFTISTYAPSRSFGPPDRLLDSLVLQSRSVIVSGVYVGLITAISASSITLGNAGFSSENFAGYNLSLLARADQTAIFSSANLAIVSNSGNTLNVTSSIDVRTIFNVGDIVVIRSKPSGSSTTSSIVDPLWVNGGGVGLTPHALQGKTLVSFGPSMEIVEEVLIADNDATGIMLAAPMSAIPTAYVITDQKWSEESTGSIHVQYYDITNLNLGHVTTLQNFAQSYLIRILSKSANGDRSPENSAQTREIYLFGQPGTTVAIDEGYHTMSLLGGILTPDLSAGVNQYALLNGDVMIGDPVAPPTPTLTYTLIFDQDGTGGHSITGWGSTYFIDFSVCDPGSSPNTRAQVTLVYRSGKSSVSGIPSTNQPIPF